MANIAEKTACNVFYQCRTTASKHNEQLCSREGAADLMSIDRGRLYRIESGVANPYPEEVHMMADLYNAPELRNHYCHNMCPLGNTVPEVETGSIDRISLKALGVLKDAKETRKKLLEIAKDGVIDDSEKEDMQEILDYLEEINKISAELRAYRISSSACCRSSFTLVNSYDISSVLRIRSLICSLSFLAFLFCFFTLTFILYLDIFMYLH